MTLVTAEGLILAMVRHAAKGICHPPGVVHHALLRWLHTQGESAPALEDAASGGELVGLVHDPRLRRRRAPGATCLSALRAATQFGQLAENDSKGCGTIMRVAPLAFVAPERVRDMVEECSALTHGHPTGQQAAAAWALMLQAIHEGCGIEQAAPRQLGRFNGEVEGAIRAALSAPQVTSVKLV